MHPLDYYCDTHVHSTLKPSAAQLDGGAWPQPNDLPTDYNLGRTMSTPRSDFDKMHRGGVRVVFLMLHVMERYMFSKLATSPAIVGKVLNIEVPKLRSILATQPFKLLQQELAYLKANLRDPNTGREAVIVRNYTHLKEVLETTDHLAIWLGIEGSHNLGFEYRDEDFLGTGWERGYNLRNESNMTEIEAAEPISEALVDERIRFMQANHIQILTLNHFVFNHLGTQPKAIEQTGIKKIGHNPVKSLHIMGQYRGLTFLGAYMVDHLMKAGIAVDIKHADAISRHQIYQIARRHNMPVIGTHMAVSGKPTNVRHNGLIHANDLIKDRRQAERFNPWDINLHDDDIVAIHELGGLIGLILDKRVLGSATAVQHAARTGEWLELFFAQIRHVYDVLRAAGFPPKECLDTLAIGSDFDGLIDPIDPVLTSLDFRYNPAHHAEGSRKLDNGLLELFRKYHAHFRETQLEPEEMTAKILRDNPLAFLQRMEAHRPVSAQLAQHPENAA